MNFKTRKIIMPAHLNGAQTLFGGQALAWIDEEAAVYAACQVKTHKIVTKLISEVNFIAPARLGDIIEIGCKLVKFGQTSITVSCEIRNKSTQATIVTVDKIVFVCFDMQTGKTFNHGITEESSGD